MPNTATSWASLFKMELFKLSGASVTPRSILVFLATLVGAAIAGRLVRRVTTSFLISRGGAQAQGTAYAVARMAQYLIALIVVLMGLDNIGLSLSSLADFETFLSVGVGFGLQNIVQNFVSGLILRIERPVQKGDFVRIGDTAGTVEEIARPPSLRVAPRSACSSPWASRPRAKGTASSFSPTASALTPRSSRRFAAPGGPFISRCSCSAMTPSGGSSPSTPPSPFVRLVFRPESC